MEEDKKYMFLNNKDVTTFLLRTKYKNKKFKYKHIKIKIRKK